MLKNFLEEFKKFAMRGNVMDMAVGFIVGAAFTKIVNSLVNDILMPPLGLLLGRVDFTNLYFTLKQGVVAGPYASLEAAQRAGAVTINYGMFVNNIISFIIVAFAIFILIKGINKLQEETAGKKPAPSATTKTCPYCFTTIDIRATRCPNCTADLSNSVPKKK